MYKQGLEPKYPDVSVCLVVVCSVFWFPLNRPESRPEYPKRQRPPSPFYLAL